MTRLTPDVEREPGSGWLPKSTKDRWSAVFCCLALLLALAALAALIASLI
jgi:hypothetical protein